MWKAVGLLALVITTSSVNSTCMFQYYQPKMPRGSEKLKHN
ncbi:cyclic lactone autoinducer peptide [Anaerotignum lactatifermentans]|nr:cyclic lactone autoinducer peptide [Anaerotignum lactatifermentans]